MKKTCNCIFLGDAGVGKTTILGRLQTPPVCAPSAPSVGVDCTELHIPSVPNVSILLWDTAGQERFQSIVKQYYRDAHICVLVYAVDDPASLQHLVDWYRAFLRHNRARRVHLVVVGNKTDLPRKVDALQGQDMATRFGAHYHESQPGANVRSWMQDLAIDVAVGRWVPRRRVYTQQGCCGKIILRTPPPMISIYEEVSMRDTT